jgi:hypothetical protein
MDQQSGQPDIYLERDSTRIVNTFAVTTSETPGRTRVSVEPQQAAVSAGPGAQLDGGSVSVRTDDDDFFSRIDAREGDGRLDLRNQTSQRTIVAAAERGRGELRLLEDREVTVEFSSREGRGRLDVNDESGDTRIRVRAARTDGSVAAGVADVRNAQGDTRATLDGRDAAVELDGATPGGDDAELGGGDMLVRQWAPEDELSDTHVQLTAEEESEHGIGNDNQPRMLFYGPDGRLEIGRGTVDATPDDEDDDVTHPGVDGRIELRHNLGVEANTMLAAEPGTLDFKRVGQYSLPERIGLVHGGGDGLQFVNGNGDTTLEVPPDVEAAGEIRTVTGIITPPTISKVGPELPETAISAERETTAEIPLIIGDGGDVTVTIGDSDVGYELKGTVSRGYEVCVTLLFDAAAAGKPNDDTPTLTIDGDASWTPTSETELQNPPLDSATYDLRVEDSIGVDLGKLQLLASGS